MTILGTISLWLALLLATWGTLVGFVGHRLGRAALLESARRAALALSVVLGVSIVSLLAALFRADFNVAYVAEHASRTLPGPYLAAALDAGWAGKLLVGAFFFSLSAALRPSIAALGLLALAGIALLAGNPFARLPTTPLDGRGLDPALLNVGFIVGPALVLLGYAALATGAARLADWWIARGDPGATSAAAWWTLAAWALVSAGAAVVLWWAYGLEARGPGRWDVTDTGVVPLWLTLTALLGGLGIRRRRAIAVSRRRGAFVASAGLLLVGLAALMSRFDTEQQLRLKPGESASFRSRLGLEYDLTHVGVSRFETTDRFVTAATLDVRRSNGPVGLVISEQRQYFDAFGRPLRDPITKAGVLRGSVEDLRVVLLDQAAATEEAVYRVRTKPLMWCAWLGAGLMIVGGLVALVPART